VWLEGFVLVVVVALRAVAGLVQLARPPPLALIALAAGTSCAVRLARRGAGVMDGAPVSRDLRLDLLVAPGAPYPGRATIMAGHCRAASSLYRPGGACDRRVATAAGPGKGFPEIRGWPVPASLVGGAPGDYPAGNLIWDPEYLIWTWHAGPGDDASFDGPHRQGGPG